MGESIVVSHDWSEEDFDWNGLYKAQTIIEKWCRCARLAIHAKEKYGTIRQSLYPWRGSLHELIYPGYVSSQFPNWLWHVDCLFISKYMPKFIIKFVQKIQRFFYNVGLAKAVKKYPHIADEILNDAQHDWIYVYGDVIHTKFWKSCD